MIESIDLVRLRNGEYSQLLIDVIRIVAQSDPATLQVVPQYNALKQLSSQIETLFKIPTGNAITRELEQYDLLRDNALYGIQSIIRGYTYSADAALKKHADALTVHLATFGRDIPTDSYQSETSSIRNIIDDWENKQELADAIRALDLASWKEALDDANGNFSDSYLKRAVDTGTANADNLKLKRIEANDAYYALRDMLNAFFVINKGADPYHTVTASLNGLLTNYNDLLARRGAGTNDEEQKTNDQ